MLVVIVFLSILNQMEFHLIQNRKENCHHDHIPFNVKGNVNIAFSAYALILQRCNPSKGFVQRLVVQPPGMLTRLGIRGPN